MTLILVHPSPHTAAKEIAKALSKVGTTSVEDGIVVLETSSRKVREISSMFGIAKVSLVVECESQFSAISKALCEVGKRTVLAGQSFFVKVRLFRARDFTTRDLEFSASSALAEELAGVASPAKCETEPNTQLVIAYVGRRAFVSLKEYSGEGGALAGSRGNASSVITSPISLESCMAACRAGFVLAELVILYSDVDELRRNAKLARLLAEKTGVKRQNIEVAKVYGKVGKTKLLHLDLAATRALARMKCKNVILPLSLSTHPQWFIEMTMKEIHTVGKVPFMPLMFSEMEVGPAAQLTRHEFLKVKKTAYGKTSHLTLEVGPNYLHDIVDTV